MPFCLQVVGEEHDDEVDPHETRRAKRGWDISENLMNLGPVLRTRVHPDVAMFDIEREVEARTGASDVGQDPDGRGSGRRAPMATVRAVKLAGISRRTPPFRTVSRVGSPYAAEAVATCHACHSAPQPGCRCGFHAARNIRTLLQSAALTPHELVTYAILDVELGGRIIHHVGGYRGEQQRVLKVHFLAVCQICATRCIPAPAADTLDVLEERQDGQMIVPRCTAHAIQPMGLGEIVDLVGTEAQWIGSNEARACLDRCSQWMGIP